MEIQQRYKFTCLALAGFAVLERAEPGRRDWVCLPGFARSSPLPGLHARTHAKPTVWEWQGGIIQEEEAEEELRLCSAWRECWLCAWQGGGGAVNHPAGSRGCGWLPAPGARVALPLSPCLAGVTAGCAGQGEQTLTVGQVQLWLPLVALG